MRKPTGNDTTRSKTCSVCGYTTRASKDFRKVDQQFDAHICKPKKKKKSLIEESSIGFDSIDVEL